MGMTSRLLTVRFLAVQSLLLTLQKSDRPICPNELIS